jgi:hypothetical protein
MVSLTLIEMDDCNFRDAKIFMSDPIKRSIDRLSSRQFNRQSATHKICVSSDVELQWNDT